MNNKTKRFHVALQIQHQSSLPGAGQGGMKSPSRHHLQEYLLVYFYLFRLQLVLGSPKLFLFIIARGFLRPLSSVFSPQIARYYDPGLGRFLQADDEIFPEQINGLNRAMYAEGNPVKFTDDSGYRLSTPVAWALVGYLTAPEGKKMEGLIEGLGRGLQVEKEEKAYKKARMNYLRSVAIVLIAAIVIVAIIIATLISGGTLSPFAKGVIKYAAETAVLAAGQAAVHEAEMRGSRVRDKQAFCSVSLFYANTPNTLSLIHI